jgi:hypothetical protein
MAAVFDFNEPTTAATCCHEAGHAAAAWLVGLPIQSIVLCDENCGEVSHPDGLPERFDQDDWNRLTAPVSLAGPLAEHFFRRTKRHELSIARLKAEPEFWSFALSLPPTDGHNIDLERVARYCRQDGRSARYQRQRAKKLFSQVHGAITAPAIWSIVRDVAERLAQRGCLVDDELAPYCARAQAAGRRWRLLQNV